MTETFVPFLTASAAPTESKPASHRMKIMSASVITEAFKPVEPRTAPLPVPAPSASHACSPAAVGDAKPTVTLQREGEQVTHIRIQCACGQVIELECVY